MKAKSFKQWFIDSNTSTVRDKEWATKVCEDLLTSNVKPKIEVLQTWMNMYCEYTENLETGFLN